MARNHRRRAGCGCTAQRTLTANDPAIKALGNRKMQRREARGVGQPDIKKEKGPGRLPNRGPSQIKGEREKAKGSPLGSKSCKARIRPVSKGAAHALSGSRQEMPSHRDAWSRASAELHSRPRAGDD